MLSLTTCGLSLSNFPVLSMLSVTIPYYRIMPSSESLSFSYVLSVCVYVFMELFPSGLLILFEWDLKIGGMAMAA